jgi:hypothetical protein
LSIQEIGGVAVEVVLEALPDCPKAKEHVTRVRTTKDATTLIRNGNTERVFIVDTP